VCEREGRCSKRHPLILVCTRTLTPNDSLCRERVDVDLHFSSRLAFHRVDVHLHFIHLHLLCTCISLVECTCISSSECKCTCISLVDLHFIQRVDVHLHFIHLHFSSRIWQKSPQFSNVGESLSFEKFSKVRNSHKVAGYSIDYIK